MHFSHATHFVSETDFKMATPLETAESTLQPEECKTLQLYDSPAEGLGGKYFEW